MTRKLLALFGALTVNINAKQFTVPITATKVKGNVTQLHSLLHTEHKRRLHASDEKHEHSKDLPTL